MRSCTAVIPGWSAWALLGALAAVGAVATVRRLLDRALGRIGGG